MNKANLKFDRILINKESLHTEVAERFIKIFPKEMIEVVEKLPTRSRKGPLSPSEFNDSKRSIYISPFKGSFFKRCPGARPGLACCNYFVLNLGQQCDMNCSYCYLQSFLNSPHIYVYSNIEQAVEELDSFTESMGKSNLRVGTGEVIDSLSLDHLTGYTEKLIQYFKGKTNWSLELKTKSNNVDHLLDLNHSGNIIFSWSINPQKVIESDEHGTASFKQRIQAARKVKDRGYKIAFHMDPVIWHPQWKESYGQMIDYIVSVFSPEEIPVMSLGSLRFQPEQKNMMRSRFGMNSMVTTAEVFHSNTDGKMRYDENMRNQMFAFIINGFRQHSEKWRVSLCMEGKAAWDFVYKKMPKSIDGVSEIFDGRTLNQFRQVKNNNSAL